MAQTELNGNNMNNVQNLARFPQKSEEKITFLSERSTAIWGLILSLSVIIIKIFYECDESTKNFFYEKKLTSYTVITENGQIMLKYSWESALKYINIWVPVLCGVLATYFTWMCVYLDSNVPGVNPPTPLSPQKYRAQSGHTFHLNYVFAVLVGIITTFYLFTKNISV